MDQKPPETSSPAPPGSGHPILHQFESAMPQPTTTTTAATAATTTPATATATAGAGASSSSSSRRPRPLTQHQLAVEQNRRQRVENILIQRKTDLYNTFRAKRENEVPFARYARLLQNLPDAYDTDDEDNSWGKGGLLPNPVEEEDFGECASYYLSVIRKAVRRLDRWDYEGANGPKRDRKREREERARKGLLNGVSIAAAVGGGDIGGGNEDGNDPNNPANNAAAGGGGNVGNEAAGLETGGGSRAAASSRNNNNNNKGGKAPPRSGTKRKSAPGDNASTTTTPNKKPAASSTSRSKNSRARAKARAGQPTSANAADSTTTTTATKDAREPPSRAHSPNHTRGDVDENLDDLDKELLGEATADEADERNNNNNPRRPRPRPRPRPQPQSQSQSQSRAAVHQTSQTARPAPALPDEPGSGLGFDESVLADDDNEPLTSENEDELGSDIYVDEGWPGDAAAAAAGGGGGDGDGGGKNNDSANSPGSSSSPDPGDITADVGPEAEAEREAMAEDNDVV